MQHEDDDAAYYDDDFERLLQVASEFQANGDRAGCSRTLELAMANARGRDGLDDVLWAGKFLAQEYLNQVRLADAQRVGTEAANAARLLGDPETADICDMIAVKAGLMSESTYPAAANRLAEVRRAMSDERPLLHRIDVIAAWLNVLELRGSLDEAKRLVDLTKPHRDGSDLHAHGYATACFHAGQIQFARNEPRRPLDFLGESGHYYARIGREQDVASCRQMEANARALLGEDVQFEAAPSYSANADPGNVNDRAARSLELITAAEQSLDLWTEAEDLGPIATSRIWRTSEVSSPTAWAAAALGRAHCLAALGRWDQAREVLEHAVERFEAFGGTDGLARCLGCSANIHVGQGLPAEARAAFNESAQLFERAGLAQDAAVARAGAAVAGAEAGLPAAEMLAELDGCVFTRLRGGRRPHAAVVMRHQARIRWRGGDAAGAAASARRARDVFESMGLTTATARCDVIEAAATMSLDPTAAEPRLWAALDRLRPLVSEFELATMEAEAAAALLAVDGGGGRRRLVLALLVDVVEELDRLRYTLRREVDRVAWAASWRPAIDMAATLADEEGASERVAQIVELARVQPVPARGNVPRTLAGAIDEIGSAGVPNRPVTSAYRSQRGAVSPSDRAARFAFAGESAFELSPPVEIGVGIGADSGAASPATDDTVHVDLDAVRRSIDVDAIWWGTWLTADDLIWYVIEPDGGLHAGRTPRRNDLIEALQRAVAS